ncbi:MAG TPA: sensor domain-containing diguanylate cyclase [Thermoleophilaceae bacterium]|nr:sensor domain-containing diguanylate cyclase [Thermoleophilaceae bacterium]
MKTEAQRLRQVIAIASEIAGSRGELNHIMHLVAERTAMLTGASACAVQPVGEGHTDADRAVFGHGITSPGLSVLGTMQSLSVQLGQTLRCDDTENDARVNQEACRKVGVRSLVCVPLSHADSVLGVIKVMSPTPGAFDDGDVETLQLLSGLVAAHMSHAVELERVRGDSYHDALTGLPGRQAFAGALRSEATRAARYGLRLTLALLDVDGLEEINLTKGRESGDMVLRQVADLLRGVRGSDLAFRAGEDEFALLLPNTALDAGRTVAERAAAGVTGAHVSVGVSEVKSADPPAFLGAATTDLAAIKRRLKAA